MHYFNRNCKRISFSEVITLFVSVKGYPLVWCGLPRQGYIFSVGITILT